MPSSRVMILDLRNRLDLAAVLSALVIFTASQGTGCGGESGKDNGAASGGANDAGQSGVPGQGQEGLEGKGGGTSEGAEVPPGEGKEGTAEGKEGTPGEGPEGTPEGPEGTAEGKEGAGEGPEGSAEGPEGTPEGKEGGAADAGLGGDAGEGGEIEICPDLTTDDMALERPGTLDNGMTILPDGRALTPEGEMVTVGVFPMAMILSPDGRFVITGSSGDADHFLHVIDAETWQIVHELEVPALFVGMLFDSQGRLWAAGGQSDKVYVLELAADGVLSIVQEIAMGGFPAGIALSPDEKTLYVARNMAKQVAARNLETGETQNFGAGDYPYGVYVTPDGKSLFVSSWGYSSPGKPRPYSDVSYIDLSAPAPKAKTVRIGKNAEAIIPAQDGKAIYVVASDGDRVDIIDIASAEVAGSIELDANPLPSVSPVGIAESPDGSRLYVTGAARNSVEVVDVAAKKVLGSIPVAWYPTGVQVSADGKTLYWLAGKGVGSGPNANNEQIQSLMKGIAGKLPVPDDAALPALTKKVDDNFGRKVRWDKKCKPHGRVIPFLPGDESPIKHVILVVKENRTYDQVLGDLETGNGDPSLTMFGEDITPNTHALARQYVNLDNFYSESEISIQGHIWLAAMACNDYSERTWPANYRDGDSRQPLTGVELASFTQSGVFIGAVLERGLEFRSYGEITGPGSNPDLFLSRSSQGFGFFNLDRSDTDKVQFFISDLNNGIFPEYVYILIPNDHTYGHNPEHPAPEWMVADNDFALGMIVEAVSKSPYWKETVIFVTEDDPQDGADHVDAHRTIGLVISPWTKREYTSSRQYSFMSFFRTIEMILDIPPLTIYDEIATPLVDVFNDTGEHSDPYTAIKPAIWDEVKLNRLGDPGSWESMEMNFDLPDMNPDLGKILRMGYTRGKYQKKTPGQAQQK